MNDLVAHHAPLSGALTEAVRRVIDSGWFVLGREVAAFEAAFAAYCGVPHAVGVGNGTDAIELALAGVGVGRGDRVALAANAGGYGTTAVLALGAEPVYVDVAEDTATLDPDALDTTALDQAAFDAVLVTHLYGRLADMAALRAVADRHGAKVVEDCAQAHGATRAGRRAGAWGDAAAFSFYPTKNLGALGDAGAVLTADPAVAGRVRRLRQYGWDRKYHQLTGPARNSRLDEIQAAVLGVQLPYLDGWNARRVAIAEHYRACISGSVTHPKLTLPEVHGPEHVAHLYVLRTTERDALAAHLRAHGVPHDVHYPVPDHRQPVHGDRFAGLDLPVTERLCAEVLSLPCHPELTGDDVERFAAVLNAFGG